MYFLIGLKENLETLIVLGKTIDANANVKTVRELKASYVKYLSQLQPTFTLTDESGPEFVESPSIAAQLISRFSGDSSLNDIKQQTAIAVTPLDAAELAHIRQRTFAAIGTIEQLNPDISALLNLTLNRCFSAGSQKAGGGSSSSAVGCVWLNPRTRWTEQDYCEFLIHELTHQLMFLDELRYRHYPNQAVLENEKNFAYSSILNRARPLDKVIHSLIVANEVVSFRKTYFSPNAKTFLHPSTGLMEESISKTIQSLRSLDRGLMTARAWDLIDRVEAHEAIRTAI